MFKHEVELIFEDCKEMGLLIGKGGDKTFTFLKKKFISNLILLLRFAWKYIQNQTSALHQR